MSMSTSVILLPHSNDNASMVGDPAQADGWYGFSDGLHTISLQVANFSGRIYIQASLALEPTEDDWFDIQLGSEYSYLQFPVNPSYPTGFLSGDTTTVALNFYANILWLRAKLDRSYLAITEPYDGSYGVVKSIMMSR
jgi:hypothetical protein